MNPSQSTNLRRDEESKSTCNEDDRIIMKFRYEEKLRRRRKWMHQQELEREHERLKQQILLNYKKKRAEAMKGKSSSSRHSRSKSSNKSPSSYHHHRERSSSRAASKSNTIFHKFDWSTNETRPLFKDPEGIQISATELRRIKVDIRRNIPAEGPVTELQRAIVNPEDVVLKRREGEGCKPIFERDELKKVYNKVEVRPTVVAINGEQSGKLCISKRRSSSLSPTRNRSCSPGYLSSYHTRYPSAESKHYDRKEEYPDYHKSHRYNNIKKHKEYKEKYVDKEIRRHDRNRSCSRERNMHSSHSRSTVENTHRSYRYRDRSNERSRERKDRDRDRDRDRERDRERDRDRDRNRDRSRDRRDTAPHYIEHVPVPIYYGNFPPRPIIMNPVVTIPRGQVPPLGRGWHPSIMAPVRPFPPRFVPPDIIRPPILFRA